MAGNTFYLNFYLQQSGFAKIVKEATAQGLVYGGESAGAVVAGSTLHGVEKVDDPAEAPAIIWEGLGLVDHGILPHADWEKYRKPMAEAKEEMEKFTQVTTINNDQALVIVDGQAEIVDNPAAGE
jgi:dipeptidase E